ncbi:hypothetical protein D3C87_64860 [compost metagenome]
MKLLTSSAILFLITSCSNSDIKTKETNPVKSDQLYKGYSRSGGYLCYLKISPDNRVIFTYQSEGNSVYGEHAGTIRAINDTLFHVSSELTFGQFACKAPNLDSLRITVNPPSLIDKKSILVRYENEELMTKRWIDRSGVSFAFDKESFNERTPAYILTDHSHPITKEALTIQTSFGSAYDFVRGDKVEFDIVISGDSIYTVKEDAVFQTGPFKLKRL